jgi:hypothetical protein
VSGNSLSLHYSRLGVKRSIETKRAVPVVLKTVPFGTTWRERKHRIETIQSLNRGLFINAKDDGMSYNCF